MVEIDNAGSECGEKKMESEDSVRTVDCLRGRLLAERVASRNAKERAGQLENKLVELENMLKQEAKSRNRAEKKLRLLMKKLKSMNISYVSHESEHSSWPDKSDISSVSSSSSPASSSTKEIEENTTENQDLNETEKSQEGSENLRQNDSQFGLLSPRIEPKNLERDMGLKEDPRLPALPEKFSKTVSENTNVGDSLSSADDAYSEKSSQLESNQSYNESKMDQRSDMGHLCAKSTSDEGLSQEDDQDGDSHVQNSMALVPVDIPQENKRIDPEVLDATVKEVLDALRLAKEQLQSSMEKRRTNMIRVG